ncbi:hypothetical protein [Halobellus ordinarius]|uniref:hypothetical protein n=1 Tax=Halobellus ordinarius TaxID=3075120 RepID=UPI0028802E56|nr:hypothetical protein [Halobellus sp. ZY16]
MLRQAREVGPAFLVPLAWTVVVLAHLGAVADSTLFVAHVVMSILLAVFTVTGYAEMRHGALRVWWSIVAVGFVVTALGTVGFRLGAAGAPLQAVALFGWMLLPAVGFVDTARRGADRPLLYVGSAVASVLGAGLYAGSFAVTVPALTISGLAVVGVGQTAAILDAAFGY